MPSDKALRRTANWRPGHPLDFESLWSITHKYCAVNFVSLRGFLRRFGQVKAPPHLNVSSQVDLRFRGRLALERLSAAIAVESTWVSRATLDSWGPKPKLRSLTTNWLRFCPTCIEHGFHAVHFQFTAERQCPIHGALLEDCCPSCGSRIPYTLPWARVEPYSCRCGRRLWWGLRKPNWDDYTDRDERAWLMNQRVREIREQLGLLGPEEKTPLSTVREDTSRFFHEWFGRMESSDNGGSVEVPRVVLRHRFDRDFRTITSASPLSEGGYAQVPAADSGFGAQLLKLLRRVERVLLHRVPRTERVYWLGRVGRLRDIERVAGVVESAPIAALLVWRYYWFGSISSPICGSTDRDVAARWNTCMERRIHWRFLQHSRLIRFAQRMTTADEWAQLHVFAMAAFRTFEGARALVGDGFVWHPEFHGNRCPVLEGVGLPFVIMVRLPGRVPVFELRVQPREPAPANRAENQSQVRPPVGDKTMPLPLSSRATGERGLDSVGH